MALIKKQFKILSRAGKDLLHEFNRNCDGYCCQFCKLKYPDNAEVWKFDTLDPKRKQTDHHLNGFNDDNRPVNFCDAHEECNRMERTDSDLQILSNEILLRNFKRQANGEYDEINKQFLDIFNRKQHEENAREHPETVSNRLYFQLTNEELTKKLRYDSDVSFKTILQNVKHLHYLETGGKKEGGGASEKPVREAIDTLCSEYGEYEIFKKKSVRCIRRKET